jgi:hypothetical protein
MRSKKGNNRDVGMMRIYLKARFVDLNLSGNTSSKMIMQKGIAVSGVLCGF